MSQAITDHPPAWDLSDLYQGIDDPRIMADLAGLKNRAEAFQARFRGQVARADLTAGLLRQASDDYEAIVRELARPQAFAALAFAADTADPAHGALLQKVQQEATAVSTRLIFFDLEIGRIPAPAYERIAGNPELDPYRHYLEHERAVAVHHLSEPEETVAEELSNTGVRAFGRLFTEVTARARFPLRKDGEPETLLTQSQVLALLYDPDRGTRRAAAAGLSAGLEPHRHVLTYLYNTLLQHKATMDRLRRYQFPEQERHLSNELPPDVVQTVVDCCIEGYPVVADYYRLKRRILGLDELTHYDRYAPITGDADAYPWDQARSLVLESFGDFAAEAAAIVAPFFSRSWIDAELRPGKQGGAFCAYVSPDVHPYVLMNYTARARDVMTLAHELGHALHGVLGARRNNSLNAYAGLPLAETASVFGEMLVFDRIQKQVASPRERLAMLAGKIEDMMATVFRQAAMYRFEQRIHRLRRDQGELTGEQIAAVWQETQQEMFGDSVHLGAEHAWWWTYIPHIYRSPFYVYAYSFGELLVLALYARYQREGAAFIPRYLDFLAAGGAQPPAALLARLGIDLADRGFWRGGIDLIRQRVRQAEALAAEVLAGAAQAAPAGQGRGRPETEAAGPKR